MNLLFARFLSAWLLHWDTSHVFDIKASQASHIHKPKAVVQVQTDVVHNSPPHLISSGHVFYRWTLSQHSPGDLLGYQQPKTHSNRSRAEHSWGFLHYGSQFILRQPWYISRYTWKYCFVLQHLQTYNPNNGLGRTKHHSSFFFLW